MARAMRYARLAAIVFAALALAAAPAVAQEESPEEESGVTCDPENPPAGSTTTCTASGLQPASAFQWIAQFTDGSESEGEGTADVTGAGTFEVEIPDSAPIGGYQVTVTGTSAEGEEYEESHEGLIVPSAGPSASETGSPGEEESPGGEESEPEAGGSPMGAPAGGVATGGGGTAGGGPGVLAMLGGLLGIGLVTGLILRRRLLA